MLRSFIIAARVFRPIANSFNTVKSFDNGINFRNFSMLTKNVLPVPSPSLQTNKQVLDISKNLIPLHVRTVTKFSLNKGKRKTGKQVIMRFFRLHWGGWIRTQVGRHKHMWKKSENRKRRLRQHQICTAAQCTKLDKFVTKFWKKPKYYVDDPYAPYHTREEFFATRRKPL